MPSSQTPFAAIFRCLSGIKQCIALAGLLTLALTVVAWKGLAGRKHLLVPAGLVSLALTVLIYGWHAIGCAPPWRDRCSSPLLQAPARHLGTMIPT